MRDSIDGMTDAREMYTAEQAAQGRRKAVRAVVEQDGVTRACAAADNSVNEVLMRSGR